MAIVIPIRSTHDRDVIHAALRTSGQASIRAAKITNTHFRRRKNAGQGRPDTTSQIMTHVVGIWHPATTGTTATDQNVKIPTATVAAEPQAHVQVPTRSLTASSTHQAIPCPNVMAQLTGAKTLITLSGRRVWSWNHKRKVVESTKFLVI